MLLIAQLTFHLPVFGAVADVIRGAVMVLFVISAVLVTLVVLAQEGKGGGLAGAFGGAGADSFGVKAGTVNKFTAWLAAAFLGLALLHAGLGAFTDDATKAPDVTPFEAPATLPGDAAPAEDNAGAGDGAPVKDDAGSGTGNGAGKGGGPGQGGGNGQGGGAGDGKGGGKNEKAGANKPGEDKPAEDKPAEDKPAEEDK